jgi:hypothetical protein
LGDECDLAGEPVEAGNEKHGTALAAFRKGGLELRPVGVASAALGLGERGDGLPGVDNVARHGLALCVEAQAAPSLPVVRNPVVL